MAKGHQDKIAVVTGAASGLGEAFAGRLAEDGANVVAVDMQPAEHTIARVTAAGREGMAVRCDLTSESEVAAMAEKVRQRFGRCDILVNNAGIYPMKPFEEISYADWRKVFAVNIDAMFLMARAFVPGMRERRWGRVVNLASNTFGMNITGFVHYVASKGGVIGFTRALASELGEHGITVNAIAPSLTRTPGTMAFGQAPDQMSPGQLFEAVAGLQAIKRVEQPPDLVGAVSFLTSDDAAFITGQTLYVDGGLVRAA